MTRRPLQGCWDYPPEPGAEAFGSPFARDGRMTLVGWAIGDGPTTIDVHLDGQRVVSTPPTFHREDIEIILGHNYPSASDLTGWAVALDATAIEAGPHFVSVTVQAGGQAVTLGERRFMFAPPIEDPSASATRLRRLLRSEPPLTRGHQALFSSEPGDWIHHATSVFGFSGHARDIVAAGGTTLVVGAGIAPTVDGVYQLDIYDYPNIDVVSEAAGLPFEDASFDGVICENVIEHVPDPFALVAEIERVLKPGGRLGLNGTNLHFTHGFPSHFFNATEFGMRYLLEERAAFEGRYEFHDIRGSLHTILAYYLNALAPEARAKLERIPLGKVFAALTPAGADSRTAQLVTALPDKAQRALSTNIYFVGRKRA